MKLKLLAAAVGLAVSVGASAAPTQWGGNGHWYDYIASPTDWQGALSASSASSFMSMQGYLATATSAGENTFIASIALGNQAWLGGSDDGSEGNWTWRSGPEIGQAFGFTAWAGGEPNNCCGGENQLVTNWGFAAWNDIGLPAFDINSYATGYVVEYSAAPVPEPETYAMMLAGLGLLGVVARRRKQRAAA